MSDELAVGDLEPITQTLQTCTEQFVAMSARRAGHAGCRAVDGSNRRSAVRCVARDVNRDEVGGRCRRRRSYGHRDLVDTDAANAAAICPLVEPN